VDIGKPELQKQQNIKYTSITRIIFLGLLSYSFSAPEIFLFRIYHNNNNNNAL
jgi:hypothetical protein